MRFDDVDEDGHADVRPSRAAKYTGALSMTESGLSVRHPSSIAMSQLHVTIIKKAGRAQTHDSPARRMHEKTEDPF